MKKSLLISILATLAIYLHAQDLIILNNGEKIEAKITEVSETEVRYKKWTNLSGPIWVKKMSEIEHIKYQKDRLLKQWTFKEGELWDFTNCSSTSEVYPNPSRYISGNEIVSMIDFYYFNAQKGKINSYIDKLPSSINEECIQQYYLEQFYYACDNENEHDIIKYGETYIIIDGEDELPTVLPIVAKIYALQGNETKANLLINEFEYYSKANDDLFNDDVTQLKQETHEILHPRRMEDDVKGVWVNIDDYLPKYGAGAGIFNPTILIINDVAKPNGANLIKFMQPITLVKEDGKQIISFHESINTSQGISFNGKANLIALQFASEHITDNTWLTGIASIGAEGTRQFNAEMTATIWSSNRTASQKFTTDLATSIILQGIENLFSKMNYSSRKIENYSIILTPKSENIMNAQVWHIEQTVDNEGHVYNGNNYENKKKQFVRWEDSDGLLFVSRDKKPITLHPLVDDDPILDEYKMIKKKTSFWRPQYSIPFFVGNAAGVYLLYASINTLTTEHNDLKFFGLFMGGFTTILVSSLVPPLRASAKREHLYNEYNMRNLEKLKRKAQTEVSVAPLYNPANNAIGASVNLSF